MQDSNKSQNLQSRSSSANLSRTQSRKNFHVELVKFLRGAHPNDRLSEMREVKFLLTYLGRKFINGYRIQEIYDNGIILMTIMQFNCHTRKITNSSNSLFPRFLIVYPSTTDISRDPQFRVSLYQKIKKICQFLEDEPSQPTKNIQINFLYLNKDKFSRMSSEDLNRSTSPDVKNYFQENKNLHIKHSYSSAIDSKQQGDRHHKLVEAFLKGQGRFLNEKYILTHILGNIKFKYIQQFVLNTVSYVIGKQCIENNYIALTSQKWMRRCTKKLFKRYDLILRNQNKVCVLDWKFSMHPSEKIITKKKHQKTNRAYYQLAKQQYKADVALKYVSINSKDQDRFYHQTTIREYDYIAETYNIDEKDDVASNVELIENDKAKTNQNYQVIEDEEDQVFEQLSQSNSKHSVYQQSSKPIIKPYGQNKMIQEQSSLRKLYPQKKRQKNPQIIDLSKQFQQQQQTRKNMFNKQIDIISEENEENTRKILDSKRQAKEEKIRMKSILNQPIVID